MGVMLATTVADFEGHLITKLRENLGSALQPFSGLAVHGTDDTHPAVLDMLARRGEVSVAPRDGRRIGWARRLAVAAAAGADPGAAVLYADLDHVLRWTETAPDELPAVVTRAGRADCTVIGRTPAALAATPRRLRDTEALVNHTYFLMTGRPWDLLMAARLLSPRAARTIVDHDEVDTIGNDVSWPLLCERHGLSLDYVEAEGLWYQTNRQYAEGGDDDHDGDPRAWVTRLRMVGDNAVAMEPYVHDGVLRAGPVNGEGS